MDTTPRLNDTDNTLLKKICLLLDGVIPSGVISFNARTGAITLLSADVTGALGYTPVNKAGDTMSGALVLPTGVSLKLGGTTASFPALKRNAGGVDLRLADDSAFAFFEAGFMLATLQDASSNTSPVAAEVYHETTGGAGGGANNGGVAFDFRADSTTTNRQLQCRIATLWTDATHATRTSHMRFSPVVGGANVEALRLSNGALDLRGGTALQIAAVAYHNPLSVYAAGTAYTLTATSAAVDFGTTDPVLTITAAGTYAVRARVQVELVGATFASVRTLTVKLRRTNNTAGDVSNALVTYSVPIVTTLSETLAIVELPEVFYTTANANDALTLFSDISVLPSAGTITISAASILAVRLS